MHKLLNGQGHIRRAGGRMWWSSVALVLLPALCWGQGQSNVAFREINAPEIISVPSGDTTRLANFGGTPLDGSIFPVPCQTSYWTGVRGSITGGEMKCTSENRQGRCRATHAQCRQLCADDADCKGYYVPVKGYVTCRDASLCTSRCDEYNPLDTSGLCDCYTFGAGADLSNEVDADVLDGTQTGRANNFRTYIRRMVTCPPDSSLCPLSLAVRGSMCFIAAANNTDAISIMPSDTVTQYGNTNKVTLTIRDQRGIGWGNAVQFRIVIVRITKFVTQDDFKICMRLGSSQPVRCITIAPQMAPESVMVSGVSNPARVLVGETLRMTVSATEYNTLQTPRIFVSAASSPGFPARQIAESTTTSLSSLFWEGPASCPSMMNGRCTDGIWVRKVMYTPRPDDSRTHSVTFNAIDNGNLWTAPLGYPLFVGTQFNATTPFSLNISVLSDVPSFVDNANSPEKSDPFNSLPPGTPPKDSVLPTAYVNCPIAVIGVFAHFSGAVVNLSMSGNYPPGMVASPQQSYDYRIDSRQQQNAAFITLSWTPARSSEGLVFRPCVTASAVNGASNQRCWTLTVARCQYCVTGSQTLRSLALQFHTSWLQIWSANSEPWREADGSIDARRWQATSDPWTLAQGGSLITLGPVYKVKEADSLDSIATRFNTKVEWIMQLNPDIADASSLAVGQDLCVLPGICPHDA